MERKNSIPESSTSSEFVLTRVFNAPLDLVWAMYSEEKHLSQWWGPKDFDLKVAKMEFKVGGMFLFKMSTSGFEMWAKFIYKKIIPKTQLSFVLSFSDPDGGITRQPGAPEWPVEILNTITFFEKEGKTTMTLRGIPVNASEDEIRVYREGFESMNEGFNGTYDQLDEYLKKVQA